MKTSTPYQLAFCPRLEAEGTLAQPAELRARFSAEELAAMDHIPERRRLDRVSGRLAAKRALAAHFSAEHGWQAEARELAVFNDDAGRPILRLPKGAPAPMPSFSISHCAQGGAAAVAPPGRRVGVDVETVIARPAEVLAFVCAPCERVAAAPSSPEAQARLWTAKEAVLKLFGLGLDADARDVRPSEESVELSGLPAAAWRGLGSPRIHLAYERLEGAMLAVAYTGD